MVVVLSVFLRQLALQALLDHQTTANVDLTRSFANTVWHDFSDFIQSSSQLTGEELRNASELDKLHQDISKQMKSTKVVKVKLYNLDGRTVYSTAADQIGEQEAISSGFWQARAGEVASEITFRNQFSDFEQVVEDRNLIASYIPIVPDGSTKVQAVIEVYSDVTSLVENMEQMQQKLIFGILVAFACLYLFLNLVISRANSLLSRQEKERQQQEHKIWYQAYHDALTGLPNREHFLERIVESMQRAKRNNIQSALLLLDLDRFKLINDSLGHKAGDQLLQITATRIQANLRETDSAYRLSGDEFLVILECLDHPEDAAVVTQRIIDSMSSPILLHNYEVIVKISVGITVFSNDGVSVEALIKEADVAMHNAKGLGHNNYTFYSQEMNTAAFERLSLETDLHNAIQNHELLLYYQPKVDANTNELIGAEALVRWLHPEKGLVLPSVFVPYLEDMGLIDEVGEWVLKTACMQAKIWQESGLHMRMSVNISAKQFRSDKLVATVARVMKETGLQACYLELELTESMFVENTDQAICTMHELKELGVSLSIDDFGSGYSSLSYLKQFPVDYLKVDRSFVKDVVKNEKDGAIIKAILALAKSLNLGIIAEGVEDELQMEFIRSIGCHEVQGYFISKPVCVQEFESCYLAGNLFNPIIYN